MEDINEPINIEKLFTSESQKENEDKEPLSIDDLMNLFKE